MLHVSTFGNCNHMQHKNLYHNLLKEGSITLIILFLSLSYVTQHLMYCAAICTVGFCCLTTWAAVY